MRKPVGVTALKTEAGTERPLVVCDDGTVWQLNSTGQWGVPDPGNGGTTPGHAGYPDPTELTANHRRG